MVLKLIQVNIPEKDRDAILELVEDEEFTYLSEFVRLAIKEKLERRVENER